MPSSSYANRAQRMLAIAEGFQNLHDDRQARLKAQRESKAVTAIHMSDEGVWRDSGPSPEPDAWMLISSSGQSVGVEPGDIAEVFRAAASVLNTLELASNG